MLKLLLKKQAQEWASFLYLSAAGGRRRSRAAIIGYAALLLYAAAAFGAMFWTRCARHWSQRGFRGCILR